MFRPLTMAAAFALVAATANATPVQWTAASGGNDHWYELIAGSYTYGQADAFAAGQLLSGTSGYLVTITSAAEQNFLNTLNASYTLAWLGGSDAASEGAWRWTEGPEAGDAFGYANWAPGEPNDSGGAEDYLMGWWSGDQWNDIGPTSTAAVLVEWDALPVGEVPVPAALPLLITALGAVGLAGRRREA